MWEHLFEVANLPFAVALLVMAGIGAFELVALIFGGGLSAVVDGSLPDGLDVDGPDLHGSPDALHAAPEFLHAAFAWLYVGRVPFLVVLVLLLFSFGVGGLALQSIARALVGSFLPTWLAAPLAFVLALPVVRLGAKGIARVFPREHTTAVPRASFVGSTAIVILGTARHGAPAQAKLRDAHGQTHYVLVEPEKDEGELPQGTAVILVEARGAIFTAIVDAAPQIEAS